MHGQELPASVRMGQRLTGMTANQKKSFPLIGARVDFKQYGQSGAWVSDLLPYTAKVADELCIIKTMHTEAINHDPAVTFFQTGHQQPGRPSIGSWLSYGLGSENNNLPAFIVSCCRAGKRQHSAPGLPRVGQRFPAQCPPGRAVSRRAKTRCSTCATPRMDSVSRRQMLDVIAGSTIYSLPRQFGDPEINARASASMKWPTACRLRCPT
jgi:hypothetical protein